MPAKRLEVELPVCPVPDCGLIGKLPSHITRKDWCNGGTRNPHRPVKMEKRRFVEAKAA
jgi:hypothetical protein